MMVTTGHILYESDYFLMLMDGHLVCHSQLMFGHFET